MVRRKQHKQGLGSEILLTLVAEKEAVVETAFEQLWQEIRLFEHTFSRFLPDSELTLVNQQAGLPTSVSREFVLLAETAREYAEKTDGLYNPFVLPVLQRAGYKGSWPQPDALGDAPDYTEAELTDWEMLQVSTNTVTIPSGTALDFGGIGKGYLLDLLATVARRVGIQNYWFSLGGDILFAGHDVDGEDWHVTVAVADDAEVVAATLATSTKEGLALATSGTTKRRGAGWNHIIDPRTGRSTASDVLTASVAAESGAAADVYAKCFVLVGSKDAATLAARLGVEHYVLQIGETEQTRILREGAFV